MVELKISGRCLRWAVVIEIDNHITRRIPDEWSKIVTLLRAMFVFTCMPLLADVNLAVIHALVLLGAHALHAVTLSAQHRQHLLRTGPSGTPLNPTVRVTIVWAILQVRNLAIFIVSRGC